MPRAVTAFSNPLVKKLRSLRDKKARRLEGLFLAEGLRILAEARDSGRLPEIVAVSSASRPHPLAGSIIEEVEESGGEVIAVPPDLLAKLSGKDNPQAIVGAFRQFDLSLEAVDRSVSPLWLVAERLRDPGNLGTLLRTGDATGAGGVILIDESVDPFSVEVVRASMGAIFTQRLASASWDEFHAWLRGGPGQLVATHLDGGIDYRDATYRAPCFLLIGNESQGLPDAIAQAADIRVTIPMMGRADSLNAAVAAAVMAYHVRAQWRDGNPSAA